MPNTSYTYKTTAAYATHTFTWEISKIIDVMNNKKISEYRTKKSFVDLRPQLKLIFLDESRDVIIYFLFPFPTQVRVNCFLEHNQEEILSGTTTTFQNVDANQWQPLCELVKKDLTSDFWKTMVYLHIKFETREPMSNQLKKNLENVLNTGNFSDVVMKSNEGKEFKVHKVILACRSTVLKAHIDHATTECRTNVVDAPFESGVVEEVLSYIYSEKVTRIKEIPRKLLAAADYYQLYDLKNLCGIEISKQLSVENVLDTLELAELYRVDSLKRSALEFIRDDNSGLITQTENWKSNLSADLLKSIYECIHPRSSVNIEYSEETTEERLRNSRLMPKFSD